MVEHVNFGIINVGYCLHVNGYSALVITKYRSIRKSYLIKCLANDILLFWLSQQNEYD